MLRTKVFMKIFTVTVPGLLAVKRIFTVFGSKNSLEYESQ
jgi:hypothetical protein